ETTSDGDLPKTERNLPPDLAQQVDVGSLELPTEALQGVNPVLDHRAPPLRVPTDLVEDDALVLSFNDLQIVVRTPLRRTLLLPLAAPVSVSPEPIKGVSSLSRRQPRRAHKEGEGSGHATSSCGIRSLRPDLDVGVPRRR